MGRLDTGDGPTAVPGGHGAHTGRPEPGARAPVAAAPEALVVSGGWQIEGLTDIVRSAGPQAAERTVECVTAQIRNPVGWAYTVDRATPSSSQRRVTVNGVSRLNHRSALAHRSRPSALDKNPSPSSADRSWRGAAGSPERNAQPRPHRRRTHARHPPPASSSSPGSDSGAPRTARRDRPRYAHRPRSAANATLALNTGE